MVFAIVMDTGADLSEGAQLRVRMISCPPGPGSSEISVVRVDAVVDCTRLPGKASRTFGLPQAIHTCRKPLQTLQAGW